MLIPRRLHPLHRAGQPAGVVVLVVGDPLRRPPIKLAQADAEPPRSVYPRSELRRICEAANEFGMLTLRTFRANIASVNSAN